MTTTETIQFYGRKAQVYTDNGEVTKVRILRWHCIRPDRPFQRWQQIKLDGALAKKVLREWRAKVLAN